MGKKTRYSVPIQTNGMQELVRVWKKKELWKLILKRAMDVNMLLYKIAKTRVFR